MFEPYTEEAFTESQEWIAQREIFEGANGTRHDLLHGCDHAARAARNRRGRVAFPQEEVHAHAILSCSRSRFPLRLTLALSVAPRVADAAAGQSAGGATAAFNNACRTCHSIKEGDHRIGPSLHKIFGSKAGSRPGFNSSAAMKNSGLTWNEEHARQVHRESGSVAPNQRR